MSTLNRRQFAGTVAGTLPFFMAFRGRTQPARAITAPDAALLDRLPKLMDVTGVPGLAAAVVRDGRLTWQKYEGLSGAGTSRMISAGTMFPAASLGKPVFTYAALRLVEEGKLDLDRPLRDYVPDHAPADPRGDKVTARHVLSHSSGFRNWRNASQPLVPEFDPGTRFQYSGEGFYHLQRAVEKITGGAFEQFMVERLFEPFGMKSSTYAWRSDTDARLVLGHHRGNVVNSQSRDFANRLFQYTERQGRPLASFTHDDVVAAMAEVKPAPRALPNFMLPNAAASLLTTLPDYAAFLVRVLAPTGSAGEIAQATRRQMLSSVTKINSALSWGLGWGLEQDRDREYVWHWGDNGNFKNFVLLHLPTRSAVVVFTNATHGMRVAEAIVNAVSGVRHLAFDWL